MGIAKPGIVTTKDGDSWGFTLVLGTTTVVTHHYGYGSPWLAKQAMRKLVSQINGENKQKSQDRD